jgi:hypothetical protein
MAWFYFFFVIVFAGFGSAFVSVSISLQTPWEYRRAYSSLLNCEY